MTKKILLLGMMLLFAISCSQNDDLELNPIGEEAENVISIKLNQKQAKMYASIFTPYLDQQENSDKEKYQKKLSSSQKELENIDYLIEGNDTLLYSLNYKNEQGFILIAGDNGGFPILAHSGEGNLYFDEIDSDSPLVLVIEASKQRVREHIKNPISTNLEYYENWKDLGKEGYEYEIEISSDEPISMITGRRTESSGKESIYPYTGRDLNNWRQSGGYNEYAPNKAAIGCPAVAIGMLLYDTSNRFFGSHEQTFPTFNVSDRFEESSAIVSKRLRFIADNIPNYKWGRSVGAESGANPSDILKGLHTLGYTKAQLVPFNFEMLYKNLSFKGLSFIGTEMTLNRSVLIGAYHNNGGAGHIWLCDGYYEQTFSVSKKIG
ncbi:MAG: Spi family protease inhibitor [Capnocytophaga sp.]|nr:Spi family protease inhibitor [Capnocytophaga sp.]